MMALLPLIKAFDHRSNFKAWNWGVKVSVVASLSEIVRIIGPDAPYNDNQMKILIIELLNMPNQTIFFCFRC